MLNVEIPGSTAAARFNREGVLFPIPVIPGAEIAQMRARFEALGAGRNGQLAPIFNLKLHLLIPWLWQLVHDPRVLDPVEAVLGPDILCWGASFFDKRPGDPGHVHWHQDATYWGLDRPDALTAWIAFTPSTPANGCMRVIPGSHRHPLQHVHSDDTDNMLAGQEMLGEPVDEAEAIDVVLQPGEMSLHQLLLVHGSGVNESTQRRTGFAIRYIAGDLRQTGDLRGTATLVRGRDFGHFDLEQAPESDFDPLALRRYSAVFRRAREIVSRQIEADRSLQANLT